MRRFIPWLFLVLLIGMGALAAPDFAIPTDEPNMRELSQEAWDVYAGTGEWPQSLARKYHGPLAEWTIAAVEHLSGIRGIDRLTALRHFITFLFFAAGTAGFFSLARRIFGDWRVGMLGALMLVLSPRMFAHAFINSRDVPHLALFTIAMAALFRFLDRKTILNAILLGIACAADIAVRSMGVLLVPLVLAGILLDVVPRTQGVACNAPTQRILILTTIFLMTCAGLTVLFWPLLWHNPVRNLMDALQFAGSFGGGGLYMGRTLTALPWHYVFVWIGITTPLLYSLLFLIGLPTSMRGILRRDADPVARRIRTLILLWFVVPIVPVMLGSGIYNEWRHLFFVYPAFLVIALEGLLTVRRLLRRWLGNRTAWTWARSGLMAVVTLGLLRTGWWMWRNHPLQHLYFSIPASLAQGNFDLDYWGLTSREAIASITALDRRPKIALRVTNNITLINARTFFPEQILYGTEVDARAEYIVDTSSEQRYAAILPPEDLLAIVGVDGLRAASVYAGPALKEKLLRDAAESGTEQLPGARE